MFKRINPNFLKHQSSFKLLFNIFIFCIDFHYVFKYVNWNGNNVDVNTIESKLPDEVITRDENLLENENYVHDIRVQLMNIVHYKYLNDQLYEIRDPAMEDMILW